MRLIKRNKLLAIVLLFNISFAGMCSKGGDRTRTLAKASDDFAQGLKATGELLQNAKTAGLISQEDVNEVKPFLLEAAKGNDEVIKYAKELLANGGIDDPEKQNDLVERINTISNIILKANQAGLFRIKDEKTKATFSLLVGTLNATITSVITIIRMTKNG